MDVEQNSAPILQAGLADNVAGALAYITVIPAIVFLVMEPYNKRPFVRYNAFQCLALTVVAIALSFFLVIPILGWILVPLLDLSLFVVWILCVWNAYQGKLFKLPLIAPQIETLSRQ